MNNGAHKILIVDDVALNIQVVANILKPEGYTINYAQEGKKAIELAEHEQFDLILLDIMMPVMDGYQVCKQIKQMEAYKNTPIIFLTAKTEIDSITKAFEVGGVDYIVKPFNKDELIVRVKTHTLLKKSIETITQQNQELRELNATKDKLFSIIAHDLKNPFHYMINSLDYVDKQLTPENIDSVKELLNLLHDSTKESYNLLVNLLDWSRMQTGTFRIQISKIMLGNLINVILKLLGTIAENKNITIENNIEVVEPVFADENMVKTVLRNLISNAIKFTHKGGKIMISAEHSGDMLKVTVSDNGMGMDKKTMDGLFKIDQKVNSPGTNNEQGTGLGLIICKEFVEKNSGKLWVESEPGKGSDFHFTLPTVE